MCISQKESPKPAKTHKNAGKKTTTTPQKHPPKANINETQQSTKKQPTTTPTNRHDNQPKNQSSITMTSKNQPQQPKKQTTHYRVLKQPATTRNTPKPEHTSRNDPHNTTHTHTNTQTPSPHPKNHPPTTHHTRRKAGASKRRVASLQILLPSWSCGSSLVQHRDCLTTLWLTTLRSAAHLALAPAESNPAGRTFS